MKNSFGNSLSITIFGESHGPYIGAVLDGIAPGIAVDREVIDHLLELRRPSGRISTSRVEGDEYIFASGVYNGHTTGTALTILIPNKANRSEDYDKDEERLARPGHADYTAHVKYHGFEDYHGGGHFSGRITAALVAAAGVIYPALRSKGIRVGTHIQSLGGINDRAFDDYDHDIDELYGLSYPVLDSEKAKEMIALTEKAGAEGDSVGGVLESVITGLPAGLGEPWFDSFESILSHALFSVPGIKGIQFGAGFDLCGSKGSVFNDPFFLQDGTVRTKTNNNGGINGGITNGMPVTFRLAVKPTPSIYREQDTVTVDGAREGKLVINGRHDPAIIHRARVVVDAVTMLTVYDIMSSRFGTDFFGPEVR